MTCCCRQVPERGCSMALVRAGTPGGVARSAGGAQPRCRGSQPPRSDAGEQWAPAGAHGLPGLCPSHGHGPRAGGCLPGPGHLHRLQRRHCDQVWLPGSTCTCPVLVNCSIVSSGNPVGTTVRLACGEDASCGSAANEPNWFTRISCTAQDCSGLVTLLPSDRTLLPGAPALGSTSDCRLYCMASRASTCLLERHCVAPRL